MAVHLTNCFKQYLNLKKNYLVNSIVSYFIAINNYMDIQITSNSYETTSTDKISRNCISNANIAVHFFKFTIVSRKMKNDRRLASVWIFFGCYYLLVIIFKFFIGCKNLTFNKVLFRLAMDFLIY